MTALFLVGAYWGLGIAGPSAWPGVALLLGLAVLSIGLAAGLWTGFGGRRVAIVSIAFGAVFAGISLVNPWGDDHGLTTTNLGGALIGLAIVLASVFALRGYPRSR